MEPDSPAASSLRRDAPTARDLGATALLILLGAASAWLYCWGGDLHRFTQWVAAYIGLFIAHFFIYLIACFVIFSRRERSPRGLTLLVVSLIILFGAGFRAQLVNRKPYLSTDAYRYIWDGRVQAAGVNPYRYVPSAPELAHLREDRIYPNINRGDYAQTPYPPGAQAIYLGVYLAHPLSVTAFKVAMSLFDLASMLALILVLARLGLDPARVIVFAWHPLIIWEGAHSGHIESAFIAFLALALLARTYNRPGLTGAAVALAALVKFYPAMLLPVFMTVRPGATGLGKEAAGFRQVRALFNADNVRLVAAFVLTVGAVYLPYLTVGTGVFGSLGNEFKEEGFIDGGMRYFLLVLIRLVLPLPTWAFTIMAALALAGAGVWVLLGAKRTMMDAARLAAVLIGFYLLLTTPRYPWYYAWLIPYLCFVPRLGWFYLTGATVLLYLVWYTPWRYPELPLWLGATLYLPTLALLYYEYRKARRAGRPHIGAAGGERAIGD